VEAQVTVVPIGRLVGDAGQLRSVFTNLLSNAVRYRSPERTLQVSVEVDDGPFERTFTVRDNGRGIPPADRERSFAMFERHDASIPGSGIGLATCQRIIDGHGGRIWMSDGIDGGLAVRFSLPAQVLDHPAAVRSTP
jgi:signal transduction histidine kinase